MSRKLQTDEAAAQLAEHGRRIEMLEGELLAVHESVSALVAAADFQHQLATPADGSGAKTIAQRGR